MLPSNMPTSNPPFGGPNERKSGGMDETMCEAQKPNPNPAKVKHQAPSTAERGSGTPWHHMRVVEEASDSRAVQRQRGE